jgi:hypothetical protein
MTHDCYRKTLGAIEIELNMFSDSRSSDPRIDTERMRQAFWRIYNLAYCARAARELAEFQETTGKPF